MNLSKLKQLRVRNPFYFLMEERVIEVVHEPTKGRVIKVDGHASYTFNLPKGGRVTKAMPKPLRKIKEAQEIKVDDV